MRTQIVCPLTRVLHLLQGSTQFNSIITAKLSSGRSESAIPVGNPNNEQIATLHHPIRRVSKRNRTIKRNSKRARERTTDERQCIRFCGVAVFHLGCISSLKQMRHGTQTTMKIYNIGIRRKQCDMRDEILCHSEQQQHGWLPFACNNAAYDGVDVLYAYIAYCNTHRLLSACTI